MTFATRFAAMLREGRRAFLGTSTPADWFDAAHRVRTARRFGVRPADLASYERGAMLPSEAFVRAYTPRLGMDAECAVRMLRLAVREHRCDRRDLVRVLAAHQRKQQKRQDRYAASVTVGWLLAGHA